MQSIFKALLRTFAVTIPLFLSHQAVAQEFHQQTAVSSGAEAFSFDLSSLASTRGATITLRNKSGSRIAFPAIWNSGSVPPLGALEIATPLKAAAVSDEDFAIKAWGFVLGHHVHSCSAGYGKNYVNDPMSILYGYGFGCCDQIAQSLAWIWGAAGYRARIAVIVDFHTVPEIYYGNAWHMLDPDHRTFYRNPDGSIGSVDQIIASPSIVVNAGDSSGKDPVGWSSQTMADLYVANAQNLQYRAPVNWPNNSVNYQLAPNESVEFRDTNPEPYSLAHPISADDPLMPSISLGSALFHRHIGFSQDPLTYADGFDHVGVVIQADGRKALTVMGSYQGLLSLGGISPLPFPALSLRLRGEFFVADASASITAIVSSDGISWSAPVSVPVVVGAPPSNYSVDLSPYAMGSHSVYVRVILKGSTNSVAIYSLDLLTETQVNRSILPALEAGKINNLQYHDRSPAEQSRSLEVELALPNGRGSLPLGRAQSLVTEDPSYSIAFDYGANHLIDGSITTLAYPDSTDLDYVISLQHQSRLKQVSLWWGEYGANPIYVQSWVLYGRNGSAAPWVALSSGGFPNAAISDVAVDATVTDLRLTAHSSNWIGLYEIKAYGDEIDLPLNPAQLTSSSQVPEDPIYSIAANYGAANLTDGNTQTLAYPGRTAVDYLVHLKDLSQVNGLTITWGDFGTNPAYINSWTLSGRNSDGHWLPLSSGGFPGSSSTTVQLNNFLTDLRLVASSPFNWIGIYEMQVNASHRIQPVAVRSYVPVSSQYGLPTANLIDGDTNSLAYPGATSIDYEVDLGADTAIDIANINWGYFGSDSRYVQSWEILGQRDHDIEWVSAAREGFPNSAQTTAEIHRTFRKLRIRAMGANWIGVYELSVFGSPAP